MRIDNRFWSPLDYVGTIFSKKFLIRLYERMLQRRRSRNDFEHGAGFEYIGYGPKLLILKIILAESAWINRRILTDGKYLACPRLHENDNSSVGIIGFDALLQLFLRDRLKPQIDGEHEAVPINRLH